MAWLAESACCLGLLELGVAALEFGDVGEDADDAVVGRAPLADPDPASVGIALLDGGVRMTVLLDAAPRSSRAAGMPPVSAMSALDGRREDFAERAAGREQVGDAGKERAIAAVGDDQAIIGVEQQEALGDRLDRRLDRAALGVGLGLEPLALGVARLEEAERLRHAADLVVAERRDGDVLSPPDHGRHGGVETRAAA